MIHTTRMPWLARILHERKDFNATRAKVHEERKAQQEQQSGSNLRDGWAEFPLPPWMPATGTRRVIQAVDNRRATRKNRRWQGQALERWK